MFLEKPVFWENLSVTEDERSLSSVTERFSRLKQHCPLLHTAASAVDWILLHLLVLWDVTYEAIGILETTEWH